MLLEKYTKKSKLFLLSLMTVGAFVSSINSFATTIQSNGYDVNFEVPDNKIVTGIGPFDNNDEPGFDSNDKNNVIRTNDDILYNYKLTVNKPELTGQNVKIEIKTVVNNAFYKERRGVKFAQGETVEDLKNQTVTNTQTHDVKVGTAVSGVIPITVTDKFKNGHQFNAVMYARVVDESGSPLTDYVEISTKNIVASSKMNFGVRTNISSVDYLYRVRDLNHSLKGHESDIAKQISANQQIMIEAKPFRKDNSIKGLYIEEGVKFNLRLEKSKQTVKFDDEPDWKPSENPLSYQIFGGSVYVLDKNENQGTSYFKVPYLADSFDRGFSYYTENNIPETSDRVSSNTFSNHIFPNGAKMNHDLTRSDNRDNEDNTIFWSGKLTPERRLSDTVVAASVSGYELGNNPVNEEASKWDVNRNFNTTQPISVFSVATNIENGIYSTLDNTNVRDNTVVTELKVHLDSYELDGEVHDLNESAKFTRSVRNVNSGVISRDTEWFNRPANKSAAKPFSYWGPADPWGEQKIYRGFDLRSRSHICWRYT